MLETRYYKDMNRNYLIVKCQEELTGDKYQLKMITENKISGLLNCSTRFINGDTYLYYEINSLQTVKSLFEHRKMNKIQTIRLLSGFKRTLQEIQKFLLIDDGLLLLPEYIFINWDAEEIYFIYYPYEISWEGNQICTLLQFLVEVIDHQDEQLVDMVYGLYQLAERGSLVVEELNYYLEEASYTRGPKSVGSHDLSAQQQNRQRFQKHEAGDGTCHRSDLSDYDGCSHSGRDEAFMFSARFDHHIKDNYEGDNFRGKRSYDEDHRLKEIHNDIVNNDYKEDYLSESDLETETERNRKVLKRVNPIEKKQEKKFILMALVSTAGIAAIIYIQHRFFLTSNEIMLSWILLFTFSLILLITGTLYLLLRFSTCLEKRPIRNRCTNICESEEEENYFATAEEESADERYGDTVFLFSTEESKENKLYGTGKGNKYHIDLNRLPCVIGKMSECTDYCITEPSISRLHVKFTGKENAIYMTDMNSTNGTYKNGLRLQPSETVQIEAGDEIRLGKLTFCYR